MWLGRAWFQWASSEWSDQLYAFRKVQEGPEIENYRFLLRGPQRKQVTNVHIHINTKYLPLNWDLTLRTSMCVRLRARSRCPGWWRKHSRRTRCLTCWRACRLWCVGRLRWSSSTLHTPTYSSSGNSSHRQRSTTSSCRPTCQNWRTGGNGTVQRGLGTGGVEKYNYHVGLSVWAFWWASLSCLCSYSA